ncbi:MAG: TIGR04563 family protein [Myxococcota bacterium]|nr:TIGR04563 family protein [Myxococcota bacterium]
MTGSDKRKQSLYFPEDMLKEIQTEAARQDRSLSWIVQRSWKLSRKQIMKSPGIEVVEYEEEEAGRKAK